MRSDHFHSVVDASTSAGVVYSRARGATCFGLVRHPIYSAWIVFLLPDLVLLTASWPLLPTPLVAYLAFKLLIGEEDRYLERRFGQAYLHYRSRVREILPLPRLRSR
jgi:protein-S-isoprenylcysteine O-methyltransferase Ste14